MNTKNRDLIVFGEDWDRHPSSTQHLLNQLRKNRRIIWVNSIGLRRPHFCLADIKRAAMKCLAMFQNTHSSNSDQDDDFHVLAPRVIPWPGNKWGRVINRFLLKRQLKNTMKQTGVESPILWVSLPTAVDMVGELGESASIYYCGDDFSALEGVDHKAVADLEQELVKQVDLILVPSRLLEQKFPAEKTKFLPHGVDIGLFSQPYPRPEDLPSGRPIAGFYGSLSSWIDTELLAAVARQLKNWDFVLIGPEHTDLSALKGMSNVYLLGEKPHEQLPAYVCNWTVSLLPFKNNAQIKSCNPLKLREYLAVGRAVVSTDFPALDGYRDVVDVAFGADEFADAIAQYDLEVNLKEGEQAGWAKTNTVCEACLQRQRKVEKESWENRSRLLEWYLVSLS